MGENYEEGALWKVVLMGGKGKGVIAKIDITAGTLILEETPIFSVPRDVHESETAVYKYNKLARKLLLLCFYH